ncbi:MAG: hypothetical protein WCA44_15225 [Acidobacteriaceae bacterium]
MKTKRKSYACIAVLTAPAILFGAAVLAQTAPAATWRQATAAELQQALPARAPVATERIETDMKSASGITDGQGKYIADVVLITAGYSAEGKYSHFFLTQVPLELGGSLHLDPGDYVLGYQRADQGVVVHFYHAATGHPAGDVTAQRITTGFRVESFRIWPPAEHSWIQIGRFRIAYRIGG